MKNSPTRYEIFLKVIEMGSLSRAASAFHYTQAAVSHVISGMEKEYGLSLFVRQQNGVSITENGKRLVPMIRAIVNKEEELQEEIFDINHAVAGVLRIGTFSSVTAVWLPRIIQDFRIKYPDVHLEILDGQYNEISAWLESGKIDCGFLPETAASGFNFYKLLRDPLMAVMASNHPLASKKAVRIKDLKHYPLILEDNQNDNDSRILLKNLHHQVQVRYTFVDDISILTFADRGFGIAIVPELLLRALQYPVTKRPFIPREYRVLGIAVQPTHKTLIFGVLLNYLKNNLMS